MLFLFSDGVIRKPGGLEDVWSKDDNFSVARLRQLYGQSNHLHNFSKRPQESHYGHCQKNFQMLIKLDDFFKKYCLLPDN